MRDPIPGLIVDVIKRRATTGPSIGSPAQHAIAHQPLVHDSWPARTFNLVELVHIRVALQAAAFDNDYFGIAVDKLQRNRGARRAAAYDAHIRFYRRVRRNRSQILYRHTDYSMHQLGVRSKYDS